MPGCGPNMGKAKTGGPWNDTGEPVECAGSGSSESPASGYKLGNDKWEYLTSTFASTLYLGAHSHTCAWTHACVHMHTILINAFRH